MPTTPAPTDVVTVPLSRSQLANCHRPEVWLDDEGQAEFGAVEQVGSRLVGAADALLFMAENAEDFLAEAPWSATDSRRASYEAIARRIRHALAGTGTRYSTAA